MTQEGCPVDILVDLSESVNVTDTLFELSDEDKENSLPLTDSIEILRRDSLTLSQPLDFDKRILRDVTEKSVEPQAVCKTSPDVRLIEDEVFDFDLPVTPSERQGSGDTAEEEEEVFMGPMGYMEKCIAACVAEDIVKPLSPLRPDQVAEIAKEAYSVAYRISRMYDASPEETGTHTASLKNDSLGLMGGAFKPKQLSSLFRVPARTTVEDTRVEHGTPHRSNAACIVLESTAANLSGIQELDGNTDNMQQGSLDKRERSGIFTKEEPVTTLVQNIAACGVKSVVNQLGAAKTEGAAQTGAVTQKAAPARSKLLAPASKLTRFNKSKSNLTKAGSGTREQESINSGDSLLETTSVKDAPSLPKPSVRRTQSMNAKSGLPMRGSKLAVPSTRLTLKRQPSAVSSLPSLNSSSSSTDSINMSTSSIPKGPATKPQLLQPSQLQRRSLAFGLGRGNAAAQTGPLKVPAQPSPKLGDTVERPYNPGNSQCTSSSSLSAVCGSTPGPESRRSISLLPTPSKRQPNSGPSPMSLASSNSSASRRSVVSSSDAADSPVFLQTALSKFPRNRRTSGLKARKPLVQNTPDMPKKELSKWSPVRRSKPMPLDLEVSMCTKRTTSS